jgi:hypothetical protein
MADKKNGFGFTTRSLLATAGIIALSTGSALAGTISTTSVGLPNGSETVNIADTQQTVDGANGSGVSSGIISGTIQLQTSVGALNTYCVDLFDYINVGNPENYTYNTAALAAGQSYRNGTTSGTFTAAQVLDLTRLLTNANSLAATNAVDSAALQIAVWEIEYDTAAANGSYTLGQSGGSDPFYIAATDSNAGGSLGAYNLAQTWLNDVTGYQNGSNFVAATWGTNSTTYVEYLTATTGEVTQNLITLATPEPSSIAVIGVGLLGLFVARRRKLI